jgi:hypothetical protein
MPAVSRLELGPNSRTRLGPGFMRQLLAVQQVQALGGFELATQLLVFLDA